VNLASIALHLQDSLSQAAPVAEVESRVGSTLEGIIAPVIYLLPVVLSALAAVAPKRSQQFRIYPMLMPTILGSSIISLAFAGRQFFSGYLLGGGDPGSIGITAQETAVFTSSVAVTITALSFSTYACILSGVAAYRAKGVMAGLSWIPLAAAIRFMFSGTNSILDLSAHDVTEGPLQKTNIAFSQMEAWGDRPTWIALCLFAFLIFHYFGTKANKLCS
jgi:hypothetical protein